MALIGGKKRRGEVSNSRGATKYGGRKAGRRVRPRRRRSPAVGVFFALGTLVVIAAIGQVSYNFVRELPYFSLTTLKIVGVSKPIENELKGLADSFLSRNNNVLSLDLKDLARQIGTHPRIRNLRLEKIYPDTLMISASEREPSGIVNADGFYLVDREGFVVERLKPSTLRKHDLPYITGIPADEVQVGEKIYNSAMLRALDLVDVLHERNPELYARFSEVNIGRDPVSHLENMTAHLRGGMEVRFGDRNPIEKLPSLDFFIRQQKDQGADPFAMAYVDLRFRNQIVFMDQATALALKAGVLDELTDENQSKDGKRPARKDGVPREDNAGTATPRADSPRAGESPSREYRSVSREASGPAGGPGTRQTAPSVAESADVVREQPAQAAPRQRKGFLSTLWRRDKASDNPVLHAPPAGASTGQQ